jgi:opacity protein-like surface antigen
MKKLAILVGAILLSGATFGQKATMDNPWSLEGAVAFGGASGVTWTAPTVRARYFVKENIAIRASLGLGDGLGTPRSESYAFYENADGSGDAGTLEIGRSAWNAQIGGEYHLAGTDRMSPYFMLGINFGGGSETGTSTNVQYDPVTNSGVYINGVDVVQKSGFDMFGVQLGAGMDYYVAENIYVGLELGISYMYKSNSDVTTKGTIPTGTIDSTEPGSSESFLTTAAGNAALRLGWRF